MSSAAFPSTVPGVTPAWLTGALRAAGCVARSSVVAVEARAIGREVGFLDGLARLRLTYDRAEPGAPASVVVKVPSDDAAYRRIGDRYGAYEREVRFYAEVAPGCPVRVPRCFYRGEDRATGAYLLVLEDLSSLSPGDQVRGLTRAEAVAAVETIGRFHARWWEAPALGALDWMPCRNIQPARYHDCWPRFRQVIGAHLPAAALTLGEQVGERLEGLLRAMEERPHTIVHSDYRADNLLLGDPDGPDPVVVLDWQLAIRGRGVLDVARLLCGSLSPADRAACETAALRGWHQALEAGGVSDYSFPDVVRDYKTAVLVCLYFPVTIHEAEEAAGERGAALAAAQIERFFTAALELDAGSVLRGSR